MLFVQYGIYSMTFLVGPFVDRVPDKRTVFLIGLPLQALIAALVGIAVLKGSLSVALLLGAVVAMAALDDFWWIAGITAPRILVGKENLLRANGLQSALVGVGSLLGYATGAALLILIGPGGGALLRAAMLAAAAILILPVGLRAPPSAERGLFRNFVAGWRILGQGTGRPLLRISALYAAFGFFLGAPVLLITLFASRDFGGSSYVYGVLFTTYMVGVVASGLAVGRTNPRRYLGRFFVSAMAAEGAMVVLAVAALPQLLPSAVAWFLVGLTGAIPATLLYSYFQAIAPPEAVARVIANLELFPSATSAVGAIALGLLSATLYPSTLGYGVGLCLMGVGIAGVAVATVRGMHF